MTSPSPHWTFTAVQDLLRGVIARCEHLAATSEVDDTRAHARQIQDDAASELQMLRHRDDTQIAAIGDRYAGISETLTG
jgi:hypothetical protein